MKKLTTEQKAKIKKELEMGKGNYILIRGGLYGGLMFLFIGFFNMFKGDSSFQLFDFVLWGVAGLIFGIFMWNYLERLAKYNKIKYKK